MCNQLYIVHIIINHKTHTNLKKNKFMDNICIISSDNIICVL